MTKRQFGARLRELRRQANLSQAVVAKRLKVPQNTYSNWERGVSAPTIEIIDNIGLALGCDPAELVKKPTGLFEIKRGRPFGDDEEENDDE